MSRAGSWPVLLLASAAFLLGFVGLRAASRVRAVEAEAPALRDLAATHAVAPAAVLALRALRPTASDAALAAMVARFGLLQRDLGEPLAALAVLGDEGRAHAALAAAGGDAAAAWLGCRGEPAAEPAVAFVQLRQRFADRASGRQP